MKTATAPDPIRFFAGGFTTEDLLSFRPSEEHQRRFEELIAREKFGGLDPEAADELDGMMEAYHVITRAQSEARLVQMRNKAA